MTAKEYLHQYRNIQREIEDIDRRMAQIRLKYAAPSAINYSDMPKAHNSEHDLSDYIVKMDELTDYMISKYTRLRGIEVDIYMRVDTDALDTTERNVYFIHGRALRHFPMD